MTSIEIEGPSNEDGTRPATVLTAAASDGGDVSWRSGGANVTRRGGGPGFDGGSVRPAGEPVCGLQAL